MDDQISPESVIGRIGICTGYKTTKKEKKKKRKAPVISLADFKRNKPRKDK